MLHITGQLNQSFFVRRVLYYILCLGVMSALLLGRVCLADEQGGQLEEPALNPLVTKQIKEEIGDRENKADLSNIYKNKPSNNAFSSSSYLEMMLALIFIVALIIGLAWGLRRMNLPMMSGAGKMQIEGSLSLGHKEKLLIVNIENQRLLLGATSNQITLIDRLSESNSSDEIKKDFSVKLKSIMTKGG